MNASRWWKIALLVAALAAAGCGGRNAGQDGGEQAAAGKAAKNGASSAALLAPGDVAAVTRTDLVAGVQVSGTLMPGRDVKLTSPVDDVVEQVLVSEGQRVGAGQVLARFRLTSLAPAAASSEAQLKSAAADYERFQNLFKEGAASKRELESAEAAWRAAAAASAAANDRLSDATVRAPFAGVVATRWVQSGDRVGSGDPLFQLVNTSELEFEATVPSEFVRLVKAGTPVQLAVTGFAAGSLSGRVARVNAAADAATRQVKIYVTVPNRDGALVGGLFASGSVVTREARKALALPAAAVRGDAAQAWVMAIERGVLVKRPVTLGVRDEAHDLTEVLSGLAEGDVVVTGPIEGLAEGQPARVGGKES